MRQFLLFCSVIISLLFTGCDPDSMVIEDEEQFATSVQRSPMPSEQQPQRPENLEMARVVDVIDGDTFILEGDRTVRLIGINAPEREQHLYQEASNYLRDLVEGQIVGLEQDEEAVDRFDRELFYVWNGDQLVNWQMVRAGLANRLAIEPNIQYDEYLLQAEEFAQADGAGLWESAGVSLEIMMVMADPRGPDDENINGEYVQIANRGTDEVDLSGFMLYDDHRTTYTFEDVVLQPNQRVTIYSGCGRDTANEFYWCQDTPVWSNSGDTAVLTDPEGRFVDNYVIAGQ
jgi:endonuclease YncB( thermonuclease family)